MMETGNHTQMSYVKGLYGMAWRNAHGAVEGELPDREFMKLWVVERIHATKFDLGVLLCTEAHEEIKQLLTHPRDVLRAGLGQLLIGEGAPQLRHAL